MASDGGGDGKLPSGRDEGLKVPDWPEPDAARLLRACPGGIASFGINRHDTPALQA
jgi:hypothetical protein